MTFKSFYNSLFQNACNWYRSSFKVLWKVFFPLNILQPWTTCSWKLRFGFFFNFKRLLQPKAVQFGIFNINLNVFLDVLLPHLLSHGACIQFSMKFLYLRQTNTEVFEHNDVIEASAHFLKKVMWLREFDTRWNFRWLYIRWFLSNIVVT